jgi:hypothetical protein
MHQKRINLFPITGQYFLPNFDVQVKIIDFISFPSETCDLQCAMLKEVSDKFALPNEIVALCADNTTPILIVANDLAKIMCDENLKLN